jgi:hypothetical protein
VVSAAFAPLARVVGEGLDRAGLPFVVVPHPVGDRDAAVVRGKGEVAAQECVRLLTTPAQQLAAEFEGRSYSLPDLMPR